MNIIRSRSVHPDYQAPGREEVCILFPATAGGSSVNQRNPTRDTTSSTRSAWQTAAKRLLTPHTGLLPSGQASPALGENPGQGWRQTDQTLVPACCVTSGK